MIFVIGTLVALLMPAVQSARETARRASCVNRMRQLGLAMLQHVEARGAFPAGALSRESPNAPSTPWTFYRWSALAAVSPYLENQAAIDALDLDQPLYQSNFAVTADNQEGVRRLVPDFLCPSDQEQRVSEQFGPTNFAVCAGTGDADPEQIFDNGSPIDTDGLFAVNSATRPGQILGGMSKTALASESLLGVPRDEAPHDPQTEYKFVLVPITDAKCAGPAQWNLTDPRGFSWANGEFRCALYNHRLTPNSSDPDCMAALVGGPLEILFTPFGWRGPRSWHPGGVNVLQADGSIGFTEDAVDQQVWRRLSTIDAD